MSTESPLAPQDTAPSRSGRVIAVTSIASLMVALDLLVVSTALPEIRRDLGVGLERLQWTVNAYGLAFACLLMTGAALGDRFGRRRLFVVGTAAFAVASACCALAPSAELLIAARAVQGAAAALVLPLAVALLSAAVSPERRGQALGVFEGVTGLATIAGPPLGGVLAATAGWEWIFWINVPIAALVVVLSLRIVPESRGGEGTLDLPGMALLAGAAFGWVWALVHGNRHGWASPGVLAGLLGGAVGTALFIWWQRRARHPMLPLRLFASRSFAAGSVASLFGFAALYGSVFFMAQYLQTGLGYTPAQAGAALIPWTATLLLIAPAAGTVADRVGATVLLRAGLVLQCAGLLWLALVADQQLSYLMLLGPLLVNGIGTSMAIPVVQSVVLGAVPEEALGKASGVNNMTQELGGVLGVALLVLAFGATGSYADAATFTSGFGAAMFACAALSGLGACATLCVPRRG